MPHKPIASTHSLDYSAVLLLHICHSLSAISIDFGGLAVFAVLRIVCRTFFLAFFWQNQRLDSVATFVGIDDVIIFFICLHLSHIIVSSISPTISIPFGLLVCVHYYLRVCASASSKIPSKKE